MIIVEMSENKLESLMEHAEKMRKYGDKVMECLEELQESSQRNHGGYGNRGGGGYGPRGGYGNRGGGGYGPRGGYGNRDEDDEEDEDFGERRGVKGTGRYSRYR